GVVGLWKAFEEMEVLGLLHGERRPRIVVVQAEGCAPIVRAFEQGAISSEPWKDPVTFASGLRVPAPLGDALVLQVLRESGGTAVEVSDDAMAAGQLELARGEGIFAAPEGGAAIAATRILVATGVISREDRVVVFNTGTGLKYPRISGSRTA